MIVLSVNGIEKSYVTNIILKNASFHLNKGDRVGIVGDNGAGKSTLLNMIAGEIYPDGGDIFISADTTVGYLKQRDNFDGDASVYDEILSIFERHIGLEKELEEVSGRIARKASDGEDTQGDLDYHYRLTVEYEKLGGYTYKSEISGVLGSMGFPAEFYDKKISTLSGGERTRLALAALLLKKPDILILDEPTNHLDIGTLKWLEQYLKSYKGTILVVSHDRYFLDQIVNRIIEIENHTIESYTGTYSEYAEQKKQVYESRLKEYYHRRDEIRQKEEVVRRMKQRGTEKLAKRAASIEKKLQKMETIDKPYMKSGGMGLEFKETVRAGKDALTVKGLKKSVGFGAERRELFKDVDLDVKRGEKICIVGQNGIGKTTFLKTIMGLIDKEDGYIKVGTGVKFGYYDQEQAMLNDANTVIDEIHDEHRLYTDGEIRGILGRFLFKDEMVFNSVGSLSGGEKARLSLLKIMMSGANFLIFDEPTNHLDIHSREIFEDALLSFQGTVLVVSHDRYFLNKVPNRIIELSKDGVTNYVGGYDYYVEKRDGMESTKNYMRQLHEDAKSDQVRMREKETASAVEVSKLSNMEKRKRDKEAEAARRRMMREKESLEKDIKQREERVAFLEAELCLPEIFSDIEASRRIAEELEEIKAELEENYNRWFEFEE